jgi:AcrR family transcriptional regulator
MPKVADPAVRTALIEEAARITAEEGRDALTLRRLTSAVGASTMAVYTHFGSMDDLRREVRREGFARLAAHLDAVETSGDAVADLCLLGWAYYVNAITNPNLYRAMFMDGPVDQADAYVGLGTFDQLVDGVVRCAETGRFAPGDPAERATQLWVTSHGLVTLELAGMLSTEQVLTCFRNMGRSLYVSYGDSPSAVGRSWSRAAARFTPPARPGGKA